MMVALLGAGCILAGVWCVWESAIALVRGLRSRSWPAAEGMIRSAKTVKKLNSDADEVSRQELEYMYSVNGEVHRGTRIRFGLPAALSWADPSRPLFRRGESVDVYYSPSQPSISALERGASPFAVVTLAGGGAILWFGARVFVAAM